MTPETELLIYDSMIFVGGSIIGMIAGAALQFHANRRGIQASKPYLTGYSDGWDAGLIWAVNTGAVREKRQRFRNLIRRLTGRVA